MRLVIQIPCFNEAETLPTTLGDLPRAVNGFDDVLWVVIDDGSSDRTAEIAEAHGADMVVQLANNKGLAVAFQAGLDASLQLGADVIVNTDADNQYAASDIPRLVEPIRNGDADLVVGTRDIANHEEFSLLKKWLQRVGSWVVRQASATHVSDVTSGFRAYSKEAALQVNVVSQFTYTLESLIQAGRSNLKVADVPIGVNPTTRPSRLFHSKRQYVRRSAGTISRVYAMHKPLRFFNIPAALFAAVGLILFGRFGWYYLSAGGEGHIQSLIVGAVCLLVSVQMLMLGLLADLLRTNRVITERVLRRVRNIELSLGTYSNTEEEPDSDV
ncbi:MAG: glycosyltransferase family 2 protein [Actinomycetota bacterium]|nr:glycosyl transferase [Actinomycetota bacterium]MEC9115051.1 glycosyltransferase family 2 protein [Actinomycetota bacterium]